jgi:hypothetical protein
MKVENPQFFEVSYLCTKANQFFTESLAAPSFKIKNPDIFKMGAISLFRYQKALRVRCKHCKKFHRLCSL